VSSDESTSVIADQLAIHLLGIKVPGQ